MIDYYSHMAVFEKIRSTLASEAITDPVLAKERDSILADVTVEKDAAWLGTCIDHIVAHAASDGSELDLLGTAAGLWERGITIFNQVTEIRDAIENAVANPSAPDSLTKFNNALAMLPGIRTAATQILAESKTFTSSFSALSFLRPHPREENKKIQDWDWSDLFMARRSDAFVRAAFANANDGESRAFAFGVLSSYAGNAAGSAYLGHVVGAPRRSHRYRDRLARNSVGAWIAMNSAVPSLKKLANGLAFGKVIGSIHLPHKIKTALKAAFHTAFHRDQTPDFDLGLRRLVRHLDLLEVFKCPPEPAPPIPALDAVMSTLSLDGDTDPGFIGPPPPSGDPGDPGDPGSPAPGSGTVGSSSSTSATAKGCFLVLGIVLLVAAIATLLNCIGQWTTTGKKCDPRKFNTTPDTDDANVSVSQQFLTAASAPPVVSATAHIINELYNFQISLSQCFSSALSYLIVTGLVYPDELYLETMLYSQFTSIPSPATGWPRKPAPDPASHLYPGTAVEHPTTLPSQYPVGSNPLVFINGISGTSIPIAWDYARQIWSQIVRGDHDSTNLDLDADRGQGHSCWQVAPATSIEDDPLKVLVIAYTDV